MPGKKALVVVSNGYLDRTIEELNVDQHACDEKFIEMAKALGKEDATEARDFIRALFDLQKACGVDDLKMSDYGFQKNEFMNLAENARATMLGVFLVDPCELNDEDCTKIFKKIISLGGI